MNFEDCKKYNATHRCYNISMWFPFLGGAKFFGLQAYPGTPLWKNPEKFGCTITHTDYRDCLSSGGETNIQSDMPKEKAERIIKDIRSKWSKHLNKKAAWV